MGGGGGCPGKVASQARCLERTLPLLARSWWHFQVRSYPGLPSVLSTSAAIVGKDRSARQSEWFQGGVGARDHKCACKLSVKVVTEEH